jgi:hypothetical protein
VFGTSLQAQIHYWTGWADDDWTNPNNWAFGENQPALSVPGPFDEANVREIDDPPDTFSGDARIPSGETVEIFRLEWRSGSFVSANPVSLTVEGTLKTENGAAFGNFSTACSLNIPTGGLVDLSPDGFLWLAQNWRDDVPGDGRAQLAADNGGANLNVSGGTFKAHTLQVGWGDDHFDTSPATPYINVRVSNGGLIELTGNGTFGLNINNGIVENKSQFFVDVQGTDASGGLIQIEGDRRQKLGEYQNAGWVGNSVGGFLAVDFNATRAGWTTIAPSDVGPEPGCPDETLYWTGWDDNNWVNPANWACGDNTAANAVPGSAEQANLRQIDSAPDVFDGLAVIPAGEVVRIDRLEWRSGSFVGPDPVGLTVEGVLNMGSGAFGQFSIAATMTIPEGGAVNVDDTLWFAQNWPEMDAQSAQAAANGGANINVDGGTLTANTLQVAPFDDHFDTFPATPYINVRVTNGGLIELRGDGTFGLNMDTANPAELDASESHFFVDVSDGLLQVEGDKRAILNQYRNLGWLGNSVDGELFIDFDDTRAGWTTVSPSDDAPPPGCIDSRFYWTGWADDDWTNPDNWSCSDVRPAGAVPGIDHEANLFEVDNLPDTFNGFARIVAGETVNINRLEWRAGLFVGPNPVGITVEGTLNMPSAAFGNFSIASTMTIPGGGEVNVADTFWLGQNWPDDAQSPAAAANGGTLLDVNGGVFKANTLQVAAFENHFDEAPETPYINVLIRGGGLIELASVGTFGLNMDSSNPATFDTDESHFFVDVNGGLLQIQGDKTGILNDYVSFGWLGSSGGNLEIDFDVTRAGWTTVCQEGACAGPTAVFRRGDHDGSGTVDITDSLNRLGFLFLGTTPSNCQDASDFDNSGAIDISDSLNELTFLFLGTVVPPPPGVTFCGPDPTEVLPGGGELPEQPVISLGCDEYPDPARPEAACP